MLLEPEIGDLNIRYCRKLNASKIAPMYSIYSPTFLIRKLNASKIAPMYSIYSPTLPKSVFFSELHTNYIRITYTRSSE